MSYAQGRMNYISNDMHENGISLTDINSKSRFASN